MPSPGFEPGSAVYEAPDILTEPGRPDKASFGVNYIKNGFNKLNFTLNYINFDVIYAKKVL